ncbi:Tripartite tricarboxylate transporter TctB family protein [Roseivivax jejudonensis]|uniref:Tripartite tricarboxylate transporter TctB family protein n=1 Tax=Roseivivax jejudonensis TaxID=1529041 RepID=A0A1X6ZYN2_9RHOB|nr:tripartite tricarboxylate transporter TctB family protein [Roseivivax jejudonensis]SLN63701.1 Tripartite tricarboxylate transporter TctB family protein [Roseivivax jejudonensis]
MTDATDPEATRGSADSAPATQTGHAPDDDRRANMLSLEIVFLAFVGIVILIAFFEALTYQLVSSRTPLVIMVPLVALIAVQARRIWVRREDSDLRGRIGMALAGRATELNKVLAFCGWMIGLLVSIVAVGHYVGMFGFCVALMRGVARESWMLTLLVSAATVLAIFLIFEVGFNVELYRGLFFRYLMGYRDF